MAEVSNLDNLNSTNNLLSYFHAKKTHSDLDAISRAQAGLCLRCYVSEPILKQCKKLDSLFSGKQFTYRDLLSSVRARTVEQMLESILNLAAEKGLTKIPPLPNYLKALTEQIESYVDGQVFKAPA